MGSVASDEISISASGSAIKTSPLGSGPLNFLDRDSTIISFYYRGTPGNTANFHLQIYDSTGNANTPIYTFRGNDIRDSLKYVSVIIPSHRAFAHYFYTLKCEGATAQNFAIRSLFLFKK